jgi:hypothetical protein
LRDLLNRDCRLQPGEQLDQLQRFVKPGRNTAAGNPVAIDYETGMTIGDPHVRVVSYQIGDEGPMGRYV